MVKERDVNRAAASELAALKAAQEERDKAFQQQIEALKDAKESLSAQFHEIASKLLGDARKTFLEQAGEKFTQAVSPVETLLKTYQEKLQTIEKERVDHYAGLREAVELVRTGQGQVRDETRHLVNALRASPKARGRWGEQSLKNVLEQAGLSEHVDFQTEVSVDTRRWAAAARRDRPPARRPQAGDRRQMLAQRLSRRLRRGRRRRSATPASAPTSPRCATTRSSSARRPIGRSSATPPIM